MAEEMRVPFLGRIPLEPKIVEAGDSGKPFFQNYQGTETAKAFELAIEPILALRDERMPQD